MKKSVLISLILLCLFLSTFYGCGALIALVSSIFGSQGGFIFIPFLGDEKMTSSQTGKLPGMIMLYSNNPPQSPVEYKPLSGATVTIGGVSTVTKSDGSFYITGIATGLQKFTAEHPSYTSITQDVPVSDPNGIPT